MQFMILGYDAKDEGAMDRRMAARDGHLKNVAEYKEKGHMHMGAALLDDEGQMIGSVMIVEFSTRKEFDQWLQSDPYVTQKVWQDVKVTECKIAPSFQA